MLLCFYPAQAGQVVVIFLREQQVTHFFEGSLPSNKKSLINSNSGSAKLNHLEFLRDEVTKRGAFASEGILRNLYRYLHE